MLYTHTGMNVDAVTVAMRAIRRPERLDAAKQEVSP